jgi:hypothetical protein
MSHGPEGRATAGVKGAATLSSERLETLSLSSRSVDLEGLNPIDPPDTECPNPTPVREKSPIAVDFRCWSYVLFLKIVKSRYSVRPCIANRKRFMSNDPHNRADADSPAGGSVARAIAGFQNGDADELGELIKAYFGRLLTKARLASLSADQTRWVSEVCNGFEDHWGRVARPTIQEYMHGAADDADAVVKLVLLRELLTSERERRERDANAPDIDGYRDLFKGPGESDVIDFVLGDEARTDGARRFHVIEPHAAEG